MSFTGKLPAPLILLGHDPEKNTYHWEGPSHLVWETAPNQVFGWLGCWTDYEGEDDEEYDGDDPLFYVIDPGTETWRAADGEWAEVVHQEGGKKPVRVRHNFVFVVSSDPAQDLEVLGRNVSPYALASQAMRAGMGMEAPRGKAAKEEGSTEEHSQADAAQEDSAEGDPAEGDVGQGEIQ